jgi:hypothetical protein
MVMMMMMMMISAPDHQCMQLPQGTPGASSEQSHQAYDHTGTECRAPSHPAGCGRPSCHASHRIDTWHDTCGKTQRVA